MDGKPRSTFGCLSVWRLPDVYGELETPSTQHRRLRLLRSSKTGETSGVCLRSQAKLITQSVALRYQFAKQMLSEAPSIESAKRMKVNVSSFLIW